MTPDIVLADLIVDDLKSQSWSMPFAPERTWVPDFKLAGELDALVVAVQPSPTPTSEGIIERFGPLGTWPIDVAIAKAINGARDRAEIDGLVALVDELRLRITPEDDEPITYAGEGMTFVNRGWEFLARFDPNQLDREKFNDGTVGYAGTFLSIIRFPFLRTA